MTSDHDGQESAIISAGIRNINARRYSGRTPLHLAADRGHIKTVDLLLRNGADINARDNGNWTSLMSAACGHSEISERLLQNGAAIDAADNTGRTSLINAATKGHTEIVRLLLDYGANPDKLGEIGSALTCTIRKLITSKEENRARLIRVMELLLTYGADITGKWEDEPNPGTGLTIKDKIFRLSKDYDLGGVLKAINLAPRFPRCKTLKMQAKRTIINAIKANEENKPLSEALKDLPLPACMKEMLLKK